MREPVSSLISTSLCLRIVRRLLDDEMLITAQLSYLVENIHDPLAGADGSTGTAPGKSSQVSVPGADAQDLAAMREFLRAPDVISQLRQKHTVRVSDAAQATTASAYPAATATVHHLHATQNGTSSKKAAPSGATTAVFSAPVTLSVETGRSIMSPEQRWCLFANLTSLYHAQLVVMTKLKRAVQRLTVLLEKLRLSCDTREPDEWVPEAAQAAEWSLPDATLRQWTEATTIVSPIVASPAATAAARDPDDPKEMKERKGEKAEVAPAPVSSALPVAPRASLPRDYASVASPPPQPEPRPQSQTIAPTTTTAGDDGGYHELAAILSDLFTGEWVSHYAAEHMVYTAQFTTKMAPKVLELGRLWRWGAVESLTSTSTSSVNTAAAGAGVVSGAAVLRALGNTPGRKTLSDYAPFIDYLFRSFGASGTPTDIRVGGAAMPEDSTEVRLRRLWAETPEVDLFMTGAGQSRRGTAVPSAARSGTGGTPAQKRGDLPSMAVGWPGFEAFLMLLATPLSCLRRHHHACRCILESGALLRDSRQHLARHYIDVVAAHMAEEAMLVTSELGQMDVAHVVQLIDDVSTDDPHLPGVLQRLRSASLGSSGTFARLMIHYGHLKKRYGRGGRHERLVLLFSDCFCYAEESRNGRLRPRGGASLDVIRVLDVPEGYEGDDAENAIELVLQPVTKRLIFYADTPEQKWQWVGALRYASRQYRRWLAHERKTTATNVPVSSATATGSEAVHLGVHPLPQRPTVLSHRSRLGRQQRSDQRWQEFLEMQRFLAVSAAAAAQSPLASCRSTVLAAGPSADASMVRSVPLMPQNSNAPRYGSTSSPGVPTGLPPVQVTGSTAASDAAALPHASSFNSSFATAPGAAGGGSGTAGVCGSGGLPRSQTHIEYDITPWSHQSSLPRRLRSQEASMVSLPPPLPTSVSSQLNLADGAGSGGGTGEVHSYATSPARGVPPASSSAVTGRPPTASTTGSTPLRLPLMDRVDPSAASTELPPVSPQAVSPSARPRTGHRSGGGTAASTLNRALHFDSASRREQSATDTHPDASDGEGGQIPAPVPVEHGPISVPSLVADIEYDKDLEELMNDHLTTPNSPLDGGAHDDGTEHQASSSASSSHSTLIEDRSGVDRALSPGREAATPEETTAAAADADLAQQSSSTSEGHSSVHDEDATGSLLADDSIVAVTAFACPPSGSRGSPLNSLISAQSRQALSPDVGGGDDLSGCPKEGGPDNNRVGATVPEAARQQKAKPVHVDPNAALSLTTPEL